MFRIKTGQGALTRKEDENGLPAISEVHGGRKEQDTKGSVQCIYTMIEELSKGSTLVSTTSEAPS